MHGFLQCKVHTGAAYAIPPNRHRSATSATIPRPGLFGRSSIVASTSTLYCTSLSPMHCNLLYCLVRALWSPHVSKPRLLCLECNSLLLFSKTTRLIPLRPSVYLRTIFDPPRIPVLLLPLLSTSFPWDDSLILALDPSPVIIELRPRP